MNETIFLIQNSRILENSSATYKIVALTDITLTLPPNTSNGIKINLLRTDTNQSVTVTIQSTDGLIYQSSVIFSTTTLLNPSSNLYLVSSSNNWYFSNVQKILSDKNYPLVSTILREANNDTFLVVTNNSVPLLTFGYDFSKNITPSELLVSITAVSGTCNGKISLLDGINNDTGIEYANLTINNVVDTGNLDLYIFRGFNLVNIFPNTFRSITLYWFPGSLSNSDKMGINSLTLI